MFGTQHASWVGTGNEEDPNIFDGLHMRRFFLYVQKKETDKKKASVRCVVAAKEFPKRAKKIFCGAKGKTLTNPWADQGFLDPENNN